MYSEPLMFPVFIESESLFNELFKSKQNELNKLDEIVKGITREITPSLTNRWLFDWEHVLGLPTNEEETDEIRHSKIVSKLRSSGTFTEKRVKEIAWSYKNGDVSITEDKENHKVTIKFTSEKGIPPNYEDFEKTIDLVKPAHLQVKYEFTYNTRDELSKLTRSQLDNFTIRQITEVDADELKKILEEGGSNV